MKTRFSTWTYVIFLLIIIGILVNFQQYLIPIIVLGLIFLLYKFPPQKWRNLLQWNRSRKPHTPTKRATHRFRVIQGSKKDDDPPKPH